MQTHRQAAEQAIHLRRLLGRDYDPTYYRTAIVMRDPTSAPPLRAALPYYRTRKKPDADGSGSADCEMNV